MCNCGPRRAAPLPRLLTTNMMPANAGAINTVPTVPTGPAASMPRPKPAFEYVGATALTVIGPASGLRYRFGRPGATLAVDPRDRAALAAIPLLRACSESPRPAAA